MVNGQGEYNISQMDILHFVGCQHSKILLYIFKIPKCVEELSSSDVPMRRFANAADMGICYDEPKINNYDVNISLEERITLKEIVYWNYAPLVS